MKRKKVRELKNQEKRAGDTRRYESRHYCQPNDREREKKGDEAIAYLS